MSWSKMSSVPNPLFDTNGDPYSGAVLKCYLPGGTTSTSIAINADGDSLQASITYNADGILEVSGNEIIPHIDRKSKWGIFANASDATANTPFYMGPFDNVSQTIDSSGSIATQELSTATMTANTAKAYAVSDVVETAEFSTGNGGGGTYDVVLTSGVTPNTFNIIIGVADATISFVLRRPVDGVTTSQLGFIDDFSTNSMLAVTQGLIDYTKLTFSKGAYRNLDITQSNKTIAFQDGVIFKLPDNTSDAAETVAFSALEITGDNNDFFGNVEINGNSSNNSSAATSTSDRKGSWAMQGNNNTWNGNVTILDAYWVGYSIGADDALTCNNFIHNGSAINVSSGSYAFVMWATLDCHINNVISEDVTQTLNHRIRTGTQSLSTKECKNLTINAIKGLGMVGVFELNTVNMQVGTISMAAWKCEETLNFQVGNAISDGCTIEAIGFGLIDVIGFQADSILVKDFTGALTVDFASFIKGKSIAIGSIHVDGNNATGEDLLIQTFQDVDIGRVLLTNPTSTSKGLLMDENISFAPQERMNIGSVISAGHTTIDVDFQNYRTLDANIGYINADAVVNSDLNGVQEKGLSETGVVNVSLTPQTSGTITLNQSTIAYTRTGRTVHIQGRVRVASVASPIGVIRLTNLPYIVADLTSVAEQSALGVYGLSLSTLGDGAYTGNTLANKKECSIAIVASEFQANSLLIFDFTYVVAKLSTISGSHDGAANTAVLTDTAQAWTVNGLIGLTLTNSTDGSSTTITANTATTITGVLSGGTDNDWDVSDSYLIS